MNILKNKNLIILTLIISFLLRISLSTFPGFYIDVQDWAGWAQRIYELGPQKFYSENYFADYNPGYIYILNLLYLLKEVLSLSNEGFFILLKLPAILSETALIALIYYIVNKRSTFWANIAALLIALNPALIINSSIWGQIDSILSLLMVLTIYSLANKKIILCSSLFAITYLIKPQVISITPLIIFFLYSNLSFKNLLKISLPPLLIFFISTLPFFGFYSILGLLDLFKQSANTYKATSLFAFNLWAIIDGFWKDDQAPFLNISYQIWGYLLFLLYWLYIFYLYFKKKCSLFDLATLSTLAFFFLPTRIHERYLYPALPFLALSAISKKSSELIIQFITLSVISFINLYYVYCYYNYFYYHLDTPLYFAPLYQFVDQESRIISAIAVISFILISFLTLKKNDNKNF